MILKNTKQMISSLKNNIDKFKVIKNLSKSITDIKNERSKIINEEIKKIYDIVFKNLCSKRTSTGFVHKNNTYSEDIYYVCNTGISKKTNQSYSINAENISRTDGYNSNNNHFAEQLHIVGINQIPFLKVLSKQKKEIFKKFMKDVQLLNKKENSFIEFKEEDKIEINEYGGIKDNKFEIQHKRVKELKLIRENIEISIKCEGTHIQRTSTSGFEQQSFEDTTIITNRQELGDFILIEQLYTPIKKLLETELKLRLKELEDTKRYFKYLNDTFSSYLMFNELKTTN